VVTLTDLFPERALDDALEAGHTVLFEIIYPENRIVVDYGVMEDLLLLPWPPHPGTVRPEAGETPHGRSFDE
jgi:hypothetical protein